MYIHNYEAYVSVIYVNYFVPGSLRIRTNVYKVLPERTQDSIDLSLTQQLQSRRWLQKSEAPYPGYCRAPGSDECLPFLCNCEKLLEIWKRINEIKKRLQKEKLIGNDFGNSQNETTSKD